MQIEVKENGSFMKTSIWEDVDKGKTTAVVDLIYIIQNDRKDLELVGRLLDTTIGACRAVGADSIIVMLNSAEYKEVLTARGILPSAIGNKIVVFEGSL